LGELLQAGGTDAVGPLLVFLDLLERQPEGVPEIGLAHIEHEPPHAHAAANMLVNRIDNAPGHWFLPIKWRPYATSQDSRLVVACQKIVRRGHLNCGTSGHVIG
jgi:hypothetical protein